MIILFVSDVCFAQKKPANILVIIADDMSKTAGIYGDKTISTPGIDGVAKDGVVFNNAHCAASSCSPSRAAILTSMYPHQLKEGGNLWGTLPVAYPNYTTLLADNGYQVGKSLVPLLVKGKTDKRFNTVFTERERHARVREGNLSYPIRAVRTKDYLYIENLKPDRWPAGDPVSAEATGPFGDIDNGPAKQFLIKNRNNPAYKKEVNWSFEKRPAIELYDLKKDPDQLNNVAENFNYIKIKKDLGDRLTKWRRQTKDPLLNNDVDPFDAYPYYGGKRANQ